jgi:predicted permease
VSYPDFLDWKAQSKSFEGLAAFQGTNANVSEPGLPTESIPQGRIAANTFSLLGVTPILGRDFRPEEDQGAGANVAIIGYRTWQQRYGGDAKVLGRSIRINDVPHVIVGVMAPGMQFPFSQEIWTPLFVTGPSSSMLRRDGRTSMAFGRLADGVTLEQAQAEMNVIAQRLEQVHPKEDKGFGILVRPYTGLFGDIRLLFLSMLGAVAFVLLIACANVANLLLSRAMTRSREVSIRAALGAGRGRIVRQLLTESALLAVFGTLGGLLLAFAGLRAFAMTVADRQLPYWMTFTMDAGVFAYVAGICAATTVLFGLAPAIHASKVDLSHTLKEGGRSATASRGRWISRSLVVTEVALALVLLIGAGLMIRSVQTLAALSAGLDDDRVLTMNIALSGGKYIDKKARIALLERLEPELLNTPGLEAVALASTLPQWGTAPVQFDLDGNDSVDPKDRQTVGNVEISTQYFDALGVPLLRGRTFEINEGRQGERVAIVNRLFVERFFGGQDPIGRRIRIYRESACEDPRQAWVRVVGEAANIKQNAPNSDQSEMAPLVYTPYLQDQEARFINIVARSAQQDAHALAVPLRDSIQKVADLSVNQVFTMPEHFERVRWFSRLFGTLFGIFAAIGAVLAAVGLYAVIAYGVTQRTREIGIRSALGASRRNIVGLIVNQGLKLSVIGLVVGLLAAFGVTRFMRSYLIGVTPTDPTTVVVMFILLGAVAIVASYLPARRAAAVDPVIALRSE